MAKFDDFTSITTPSLDDFVVGYAAGGGPGSDTREKIRDLLWGGVVHNRSTGSLTRGLDFTQKGSGSAGGAFAFNYINVTSDDISTFDGSFDNTGAALRIELVSGGAAMRGGRYGIQVRNQLASPSSTSDTSKSTVGGVIIGQSGTNNGGSGGSPGDAKGSVLGLNLSGFLNAGATFYNSVGALQADVFVDPGASVLRRFGVATWDEFSGVQGSVLDTAFLVMASASSVGWKTGLLFSDTGGGAPMSTTATLIRTENARTVDRGIDFSSYTLTTDFLKSANFRVSGAGSIFMPAGAKLDWNTGGITLTETGDNLYFAGASAGYTFDTSLFMSAGSIFLAAGTTSNAPLAFTSGTNLTTASAGKFEYDGKAFYSTPIGAVRGVSPSVSFISLSADQTGTDTSSAQVWFPGGGATSITVAASTSYFFEGILNLARTAGGTSHTTGLLFAGTATITSIGYLAFVMTNASSFTGAGNFALENWIAVATDTQLGGASTATNEKSSFMIRGIVRINGAGTFTPQFKYSAAPGGAPTVQANSWFRMWPIGTNTVLGVN